MSTAPADATPPTPVRKVTLFRREAVNAARDQTQGAVLRIEPLSARLLIWVAVAAAVAIVGLAGLGSYTRKARVQGYVVPAKGLLKVHSRDTGVVVETRVVEGQHVSRGDVLFVISMERPSGTAAEGQASAMDSLEKRRSSLGAEVHQQAQIVSLQVDELERRRKGMLSELQQLDAQVAAQNQLLANAQKSLERFQSLQESGLASKQDVLERERELLAQRGQVAALERSKISLTREAEAVRADIASARLKGQSQRGSLERDIAGVTQSLTEYEMRRTFMVTAPADGTATALLLERGQTANPSQTLVSIVPDGAALEAQLFVPTSAIGFLAIGQPVQLRYDAFPYERFGSQTGRVSEISRALILPGEAAVPVALSQPAYRVTVQLPAQALEAYGSLLPLRPGMIIDADIWLERRRIYEWLLDPLYAAAKKA